MDRLKRVHITPRSNGCLEKFHRTLKSMLKGCGEKYSRDWDALLPRVMFAYREVPVEGFGYSPFELLFGGIGEGVLQLIKKAWLKDDLFDHVKSSNIIDFFIIHQRADTNFC